MKHREIRSFIHFDTSIITQNMGGTSMITKTTFIPKGVCSKKYEIELEDGVIRDIQITGGCNGNLKAIRNLILNRPAEEIIPFLRGITCGPRPTSCGDQISYALEEALDKEKEQREAEEAQKNQKYTSDIDTDMSKEYMYHAYRYLSSKNSPVYGVDSAADVTIKPLYFDNLCYLLSAEGTHVVMFGGTWSELSQGCVDRVNYYARKYGVDTVYHFDFRVDGESADTDFKVDITAQDTYDGPDKTETIGCADCNYIYGELVQHFLTNLNDWVAGKVGSGDDITWLNLYQDVVTVPNLHEPFIFVYNKDNKTDHSGAGVERETYPIISAMEITSTRGSDGQMYRDGACTVPDEDFDARLEETIFRQIGAEGVSPYTDADYMYDAFKMNERGHSYKTEDAFKKDEQINLQPIGLPQLKWMLDQKGTYLLLFAGAWCANSQAGVATVNDFAVANNVRVYVFDTRLDGKYPIDFWKYPRQHEMKMTHPALMDTNFEIWEKKLPGAPVLCSVRKSGDSWRNTEKATLDYVDKEGNAHSILPVNLPYLLACDTTLTDDKGYPETVLAGCNHGGIELINCQETFVYSKPRYRLYTAGVYAVMDKYCTHVGREVQDITIDRTAPIIEGEPKRHTETVAYHKEHDWSHGRSGDQTQSGAEPEVTTTVDDCGDCC